MDLKNIDKIYEKLVDRKSKDIFKARLLYSLTGDYGEICHIVAGTGQAEQIREQISNFPGEPVLLWGTGFWADYIRQSFSEINWAGYVDNNRKERIKNGLPVYDSEEFCKGCHTSIVVIATTLWYKEIYQQLLSYNHDPCKIVNAGKLMFELFDRQYFDLPYMLHHNEEIFVDAGCFDGLTVNSFIKWCGGEYKEIMAFEPDRQCYGKCSEILKGVDNLTMINKGLWSSEQTLSFHETGDSSSVITESGETQIQTVRLDDIADGKKITFIKMDIEGAETEAIAGAAGTIERCRPKLAVSIYHKADDILEIPRMILEIRPDYKFYLRHYSLRAAETVLYAT